MKIGLIQYSPQFEDINSNEQSIINLLQNSYQNEELLIFPELTLSAYTMSTDKFKSETTEQQIKFFSELSQKYSCHTFVGLIEYEDNKYFNALLHFSEKGEIIAKYRKIHPFSYAKENEYYSSGENVVITEINGITFGLSICYDLRFPELFRHYGKERCTAIINIANWPEKRMEHYLALLKARAIENLCFTIGCNRVGDDPFNHYNGCSSIFSPLGKHEICIENEEKLISFELDPNLTSETRNRFRFLDDIKLI